MLNTKLIYIEPSIYSTHIESYKPFTTKEITHTNGTTESIPLQKPYIELTMTIDNNLITTRLYSSRINYFMFRIRSQLQLHRTITLSEMLDYMKTHEFFVETSYHPTYGLNIDYPDC